MFRKTLLLSAILAWSTVYSQERGTPIFSDNFDVKGTFIENWKTQGKVENENGVVTLTGTGIAMKKEVPEEFWASVKICLLYTSPSPRD